MAWTRSAQRGETCAFPQSAASRSVTLHGILPIAGAMLAARIPLVAVATALTATGLALPAIDIDIMASLLFLAGAGVALAALRPLSGAELRPPIEQTLRRQSSQFSELVASAGRETVIDRDEWSKLTAHMSHELRTPLNAVLGFSELMSNEVFGPMGSSCYSAYARDIHTSGRRLLKTADDALAITALLTQSKRESRSATSSLTNAIDDAIAFHAATAAELGVSVKSDVVGFDRVGADEQTVRQMLVNLVAECLDRAAESASIVVGARTDGAVVRAIVAMTGVSSDVTETASAGFNLQLARTLAALSGATIDHCVEQGRMEFVVALHAANQTDLFSA